MKKGIAMESLVTIILIVVGLLVLLAFTVQLIGKSNETLHDRMCTYSAILNSVMNSRISCSPKPVVISTDGVKVMGHDKRVLIGDRYLKTFKPADFEEAVKYTIADQMFRCWDMMGSGNLNLFATDIAQKNHVCMLCSDIMFDNKAREQQILGLDKYMDEKYVTQYKLDKTYTQALSSKIYQYQWKFLYLPIYSGDVSSLGIPTGQVINTDDNYKVVFVAYKSSFLSNYFGKKLGINLGEYKQDAVYFVYLYSNEDFRKNCPVKYN